MTGNDAIIGCAKNIMVMENFLSDSISDTKATGGDYVIEDSNINKEKYIDWIGGPFWNSHLTLR